MKLSLSWIFDHIDDSYTSIETKQLVSAFNKSVAEIDSYYRVAIDFDALAIAQVVSSSESFITLQCDEWRQSLTLPVRLDARTKDSFFMIKRTKSGFQWATTVDFGSDKSLVLPALFCTQEMSKGGWKQAIDKDDWILDINNTSITHRPDMWSHRGVAREIAALLGLSLVPIEKLLYEKRIHHEKGERINDELITIINKAPDACNRFAGLSFEYIERRPSAIWLISRLSRIGCKPIDMLVDFTNYVMFDIGQPLHAFDAQKIVTKEIVIRFAQNEEKLVLLDGQSVNLTSNDLIISDGPNPLALAGIMGGEDSAITGQTNSIFLEAAAFNSAVIRTASTRLALRTEASTRFEKSIDPTQNTQGILRFLKLINDNDIKTKMAPSVLSIGKAVDGKSINVSHSFIERRLGISLSPEFISTTLEKLGFDISFRDGLYTINIPSYRGSKDIASKEDIVEEVGRFYGYDNIPYLLPQRKLESFDIDCVMRLRLIKTVMAFSLKMREVQQYAFFDEHFLKIISWQPSQVLEVKSPISTNWCRLVTTLMPNLFKTVHDNSAYSDQLRFFEWGRVWNNIGSVSEKKVLAGIIFDKVKSFSFYDGKALLLDLFSALQMKTIWKKPEGPLYPWFSESETALISHNNVIIGKAGLVANSFVKKVGDGSSFVFELDGDYLINYKAPAVQYVSSSKYPTVERDLSILLPSAVPFIQLTDVIYNIDQRITDVVLIDFFKKRDWKETKSITVRITLRDKEKTMIKQEIDVILSQIEESIKQLGASIR